MTHRNRLPNRRRSETIALGNAGHQYNLTIGYRLDGSVGEVFINTVHGSSGMDAFVSDAAILISFALQYGAPLEDLRRALKHDSHGKAASPIGAALDKIGGAS
jgi:hypothetical protein